VVTTLEVGLVTGAAFLGGTANSIAGGGTLLTYPALLATGMPAIAANVTTTIAGWPGYVTGAASYRSQLRDRHESVRLGIAAVLGSLAGTALLLTIPSAVFDALIPYLVLAATALLAAQPWISTRLRRRDPDGERGRWLLPGVVLGAVYGAYFGGGLGIVLLATLALGLDRALGELNGLKTLLSLVVNSVAVVGFAVFGPVSWAFAAAMAPASFAGGIAGARLAQSLDARMLRTIVVVIGCCLALRLLLR
jgi:uncharacterized membrane protein YfcA